MTPTFRVVAEGADITALINDRLLLLRTTDKPGVESDDFELRIDDRDNAVTLPNRGASIEVFLGYNGSALIRLGRYTVDEVELSGPPDTLVIRGKVSDKNHLEGFVRQFKWALSSRQIFEWQKMTRPETLTDIQLAARFFYLQHHAFGGKVSGQSFGTATPAPAINLLRIEEKTCLLPGSACPAPTSKTCPGLSAPSATTGRTPSTTWIHLTGRPLDTASTSRLKTMSAWLILCGAAKAR